MKSNVRTSNTASINFTNNDSQREKDMKRTTATYLQEHLMKYIFKSF